eukprot:768192-Hanusia_phi.AAC.4
MAASFTSSAIDVHYKVEEQAMSEKEIKQVRPVSSSHLFLAPCPPFSSRSTFLSVPQPAALSEISLLTAGRAGEMEDHAADRQEGIRAAQDNSW